MENEEFVFSQMKNLGNRILNQNEMKDDAEG